MDATYLKNTVGPALVEAITRIIETNPTDPIEFLGEFLVQHGKTATVPKASGVKSSGLQAHSKPLAH